MRISLKVAILKSGKSQRQLAANAGISENRFSQIVRSWRAPTADEAARIAAALGCDARDLFSTGSVEGNPTQATAVSVA